MSKASTSQSVTIEIPQKTSINEQDNQLNAIYYALKAHVRRTRGLLASRQLAKTLDPLFMKTGTTYEQLRSELQKQMNILLAQEAADLTWIANK